MDFRVFRTTDEEYEAGNYRYMIIVENGEEAYYAFTDLDIKENETFFIKEISLEEIDSTRERFKEYKEIEKFDMVLVGKELLDKIIKIFRNGECSYEKKSTSKECLNILLKIKKRSEGE